MNQAIAPEPVVKAEFHVEPHPDPVVRALIEEIEKLRLRNWALEAELLALKSDTRMKVG